MADQWYAHYPGDYARDTADLSMMETGAYRLLLDHYYSTGAPLPTDHVRLYRICRASQPAELQAVDRVLDQFFVLNDGRYHNRRADRELAKRTELKSKLSESGRRGAERRWSPPIESDGQASGHPNGLAMASPQPQPDPQSETTTHTPSRPSAEVSELGPQPDEFQLRGEQHAQPQSESHRGENSHGKPNPRVLLEIYEQERGPLSPVRAESAERLNKCRSRLLSHARDQEEFLADFRAAVRKVSQIAWPGWKPSFDWFLGNDTNYLKVLEGNYDAWGNSAVGNKSSEKQGRDFSSTDSAARRFREHSLGLASKVGKGSLDRTA